MLTIATIIGYIVYFVEMRRDGVDTFIKSAPEFYWFVTKDISIALAVDFLLLVAWYFVVCFVKSF